MNKERNTAFFWRVSDSKITPSCWGRRVKTFSPPRPLPSFSPVDVLLSSASHQPYSSVVLPNVEISVRAPRLLSQRAVSYARRDLASESSRDGGSLCAFLSEDEIAEIMKSSSRQIDDDDPFASHLTSVVTQGVKKIATTNNRVTYPSSAPAAFFSCTL